MTTITFIPAQIIGSGYTGKSGVVPLYKGEVAALLKSGALSFEELARAVAEARSAFIKAGGFPGYIPNLSRVDVVVAAGE